VDAILTDIDSNSRPIKIGISACLLGQPVRFDGGHKKDRYLTDILGDYFKFVAVCPEIEVGMPTPRETVRLEGPFDDPKMIGNMTKEDWTSRMKRYSNKRLKELQKENLSGYILKKDSPSCGMECVKVYHGKGGARRKGRGIYAKKLQESNPLLPIEEEGRLHDPHLRENFIVRVFTYHRLQNLFDKKCTLRDVVEFHTVHKLLLMAHSIKHYRMIGKIVANVKKYKPSEFRDQYSQMFIEAMCMKTTIYKNVNVMCHILGYLKKQLSSDDKQYILQIIIDYKSELVPLIVPLTLLKHYIYKYDIEYFKKQIYLNPHPKELMLRNHI
jgi:uncharacterized protein YbgA (DUF1722 family)/uncharacterized protein YbbK (DUF523 family)